MFLLGKPFTFHGSLAKMAKVMEFLEVCSLHESEVVGLDAEDVVHQQPLVFSYKLEHRGSLARAPLGVNLLGLINISTVNVVAYGHLDASRTFLCAIGHAVAPVGHGHDVSIEHLYLFIGIYEERLCLCDESCEVAVGIGIVKLRLAFSGGPDGEVYHQPALFGVPDGLGSPCAS